MKVIGVCQWPHGLPGTPGFHLCNRPVIKAPYCEGCRDANRPYIAVDPDIQRKFLASALQAADR